ncbi:MAG: DUF342 domain-containing protein [Lachnospiraceae bacterium]|nr:DUF342 domain-containing protein [Lachnospiraceae bacterium]
MADQSKTYVRVSGDQMQAYLYLIDPGEGVNYSRREIDALLDNNGVVMGIKDDVINDMIERGLYYREVIVAQGEFPQDGVDGYFEYNFNRVIDKKPDAKADGTIDYWSISSIVHVKKDQVIATYIPSVQGLSGYTVKGKSLMPKRARELPPLKGRGFERLEDDKTYISLLDGKIEVQGDKIVISEIYEITGDADLSTGNINFPGDVVIYGKVCTGISIKAGGNLTVNGNVETAVIDVGKDIIFRSGMQGGYKAKVSAGGNITAKFIENTKVRAGGTIHAEVLMNTEVVSCEKLILDGKKSAIVGGSVNALQGVYAGTIGNEAEIPTEVSVGVPQETYVRREILLKKIEKNEINIKRIEVGIKQFEELMEKDPRIRKDDPRKAQLIRAKIQDNVILSQDRAELSKVEAMIGRGKAAYVRVSGYVYPRVTVSIESRKLVTKEKEMAVEFMNLDDNIIKRPYSYSEPT